MKIYFMAPMRAKANDVGYYKKIYTSIEELGYNLTDKYLIEHDSDEHYKKFEDKTGEYYHTFYTKTIENIKNADINIFECSFPSLGLGYQVEKSLQLNKPTIILYRKGMIPHFLLGIDEDKLVLTVVNENDISTTIEKAIADARHLADKRFNFFISPSLLTYLEKASKQGGITKSTFIRNLILEHKRKTDKRHGE
jgi:hypothetical protein